MSCSLPLPILVPAPPISLFPFPSLPPLSHPLSPAFLLLLPLSRPLSIPSPPSLLSPHLLGRKVHTVPHASGSWVESACPSGSRANTRRVSRGRWDRAMPRSNLRGIGRREKGGDKTVSLTHIHTHTQLCTYLHRHIHDTPTQSY